MLTPKHKAPMEITTTAEHPFDKCYLHTVDPYLRHKGTTNTF